MNESFFSEHTSRVPLMAIYRGFDTDRTVELCHRVWDAGIELVEIPVQSQAAIESLRTAARAAADRGAMVGAGTVVSLELVEAARDAGAAFTVAPGLAPEVVAASHEAGLPHLPGVATPSEVHQALRLGLTWLKAFPAAQLGVGWADALHGPFPEARFVATGGVTPANAEQYFAGGASAASLTSALADDEQFALVPDLIDRLGAHGVTQQLWAGGYTSDAGGAGDGVHGLAAAAGGGLRDLGLLVEAASPSFLAPHPVRPVLYAVLETRGSVAAYAVADDGSMTPLGPAGHAALGACHVAVDPSGRFVLVSCWGSGDVVLHPLDDVGRLVGRMVAASACDPHTPGTHAPGPDPDRHTGESRRSRAHAALVLGDGRIVSTDLGYDLLRFWSYVPGSGLTADHEVVLHAGTGPRHLVEHPDGRLLVVTEYSCEVVALACADHRSGAPYVVVDVARLIRPGPGDKASELTLSPDGQHLYVSVRGSDRILTLAVGGGRLEPVSNLPSGGRCPRQHLVDTTELHVVHEESHEIVTLSRDPITGIPGEVRRRVPLGSPTTLVRVL